MVGGEDMQNQESFVWDDETQLYFHASSGFYHDPILGWFYSSRDGHYYKYEDGSYVLMESEAINRNGERDKHYGDGFDGEDLYLHDESTLVSGGDEDDCIHPRSCVDAQLGQRKRSDNQTTDDHQPPSEWLEETLIDLYLSGYNQSTNDAYNLMTTSEAVDKYNTKLSPNEDNDSQELEEGEWIPEVDFNFSGLYEGECDEDVGGPDYSVEEETWQAQYGYATQFLENSVPDVSSVDLWDWMVVTEVRKKGKEKVLRLVGKLVKPSARLHPSMPSGGVLLKTAPVCEAQLHMVRVKTGQVYRLRKPSSRYLASLSLYDSSNPTKDWGFPDISANWNKSGKKKMSREACDQIGYDDPTELPCQKSGVYQDRAAQRRRLHGGFGVGPGQKSMMGDIDESISSQQTVYSEAMAQAQDISFGSGSYARRILTNMGWKEGDGLGKWAKGLKSPLQAVGNVGSAGLGWPGGRRS